VRSYPDNMADRGTAWTPTVSALLALLNAPDRMSGRRQRLQEGRSRVAELLPLAVSLGVPVLAAICASAELVPIGCEARSSTRTTCTG